MVRKVLEVGVESKAEYFLLPIQLLVKTLSGQ